MPGYGRPSRGYRSEVYEEREVEPPPSPTAAHRITFVERGPFLAARCSCGWYGPARRSRPLARSEATAHLADPDGARASD